MSNPNKNKGSRFELDIERALRNYGIRAKRPRQTGHADVGDIHVGDDVVIQAKNWANLAAAMTAGVDGAQRQAIAAHRPYGIAVVKRPRKGTDEAFAIVPLRVLAQLLIEARLH